MNSIIMVSYMTACIFFIRGIKLLGKAETARKGNFDGREAKAISTEDAYMILEAAKNVVFIPGYGMAVAQAQHAVKELTEKLENTVMIYGDAKQTVSAIVSEFDD